MKEVRATKVRVKALLRNNRIKLPKKLSLWTKAGLSWLESIIALGDHSSWVLERYLAEIERKKEEVASATLRIKNYVSKDTLCQKLLSHRGIGVITAAVMRAEIGNFSRFKNGKQLARFCGFSPCNRSSGKNVATAGLIRAGNPLLKSCINQGIWTLIRYDKHWNAFAERLIKQGKHKCVAAGAVANRWLRRLFHEVKVY